MGSQELFSNFCCDVATLPPTWRCFNVLDLIVGGYLLPNTPLHLRPRSTRAGRKVKVSHLPVANQVSFVGDKNGGAGLEGEHIKIKINPKEGKKN